MDAGLGSAPTDGGAGPSTGFLSESERAFFRENGFIQVEEAFPTDVARDCEALVLQSLEEEEGLDRANPNKARWGLSRRAHPTFDRMITEKAISTFDDLAGADQWNSEHLATHGNFWATFPGFYSMPWEPPTATGRWHIDLGFESRDAFALADGNCAFVPAFLLTDSPPGAAPTVALRGSHNLIARLLHAVGSPIERFQMTAFCEGLLLRLGPRADIVPLVGKAGDMVVMHPYLVHAASANCANCLRIMANTGVGFRGAKRLNSDDLGISVIEASIVEEIEARKNSAWSANYLKVLLWISHAIWKQRYRLHGNLPNPIDVRPHNMRGRMERILRPMQAFTIFLIQKHLS